MPSITLEVSEEAYSFLEAAAVQQGRSTNEYAAQALVTQALAEIRDHEEMIASVQRGIADGEAGRERPWEEFVADFEARLKARRESAGTSEVLTGKV